MIYALIVIYNKSVHESKSYKMLQQYKNVISINVFDNSEKDYNNRLQCENEGIVYYTVEENIGLSKAYNYLIDNIKASENDYIMILDDDTDLPKSYIKEALAIAENGNDYDIYIPIVHASKIIISPAQIRHRCLTKVFDNPYDIPMKKITAINSGMLVRRKVYDVVRYDNSLFLDCVDHQFIKDVKKAQFRITLMQSHLWQSYSRDECKTIESELFRFKIFKRDYKCYCEKDNSTVIYILYMFRYCFKLLLKYRSFRFFKIFIGD